MGYFRNHPGFKLPQRLRTAPVVPLLSSGTTGSANEKSGSARGSRHSRTASMYHLPVFSNSELITPILSLFNLFYVFLFAVTFSTSRQASLLLSKLLLSSPNSSRRLEPLATLPVSFCSAIRFLPSSTDITHFPPCTEQHKLVSHPFPSSVFNTRSDSLPLFDRDPYHDHKRALSLRTEDTISVVNTASPFPFLSSLSLSQTPLPFATPNNAFSAFLLLLPLSTNAELTKSSPFSPSQPSSSFHITVLSIPQIAARPRHIRF